MKPLRIYKRVPVTLAIIIMFSCLLTSAFGQNQQAGKITDRAEIAKLKAAVEATPDSMKVHQAYISGLGVDSKEVHEQYAEWMKKFPNSSTVAFAMGDAYCKLESPKAKPYLVEAVKRNPKNAQAWGDLWLDSDRWGDFESSKKYLLKATEADPSNGRFAFYYANQFKTSDYEFYKKKSLELTERFPNDNWGVYGLFFLALNSPKTEDRVKYYEEIKRKFAPEKYSMSANGMTYYYEMLISTDAPKALALSHEMVAVIKPTQYLNWTNLEQFADQFVKAQELVKKGSGSEALSVINSFKVPKYLGITDAIVLLKALAIEKSGDLKGAYDTLMKVFIKNPKVSYYNAMLADGAKISKNKEQVTKDIYANIDAVATPATDFSLKYYGSDRNGSLADFKGKVLLLTYWFPGCGPCRGEFPHFQTVVDEFKNKPLAYVGLNINQIQHEYVLPFMKQSGYTFTPMADVEGRNKGNLNNRNAAPVNFLIDQKGRLIFTDFRASDTETEDDLKLMIDLLMAKGQQS